MAEKKIKQILKLHEALTEAVKGLIPDQKEGEEIKIKKKITVSSGTMPGTSATEAIKFLKVTEETTLIYEEGGTNPTTSSIEHDDVDETDEEITPGQRVSNELDDDDEMEEEITPGQRVSNEHNDDDETEEEITPGQRVSNEHDDYDEMEEEITPGQRVMSENIDEGGAISPELFTTFDELDDRITDELLCNMSTPK